MLTAMARFKPIYVRRSDGKVEVVAKGKRRERNEPTPDQLDASPDKNGVSDFYREVALEEVKSLDWRRKLGGMLAREFALDDKNALGRMIFKQYGDSRLMARRSSLHVGGVPGKLPSL